MPWRPQPQPPTTHQVGNLSSLRGRMRFQDRQSLPWNEFSRAKIWESKKTSNRMEFWVWMLYLCFFPMLHCEKGTTFHWRFQLLKSIPLILMKLNISKNCGKKTLDEFYHTLLKTRVEIVTNHPCFLFSAMCLSKIWVRHRYAEGSDPLPHPRIPCESWLSENHHLQHHGSIQHRLTRNLQATTSICVAFHQQFGYPLVKLSNGIFYHFFLSTQHFLLVHTISNGGCFHCHVGTLDVKAAPCTPGGYAGWWLGVSKKTGMKRDSLLEEPIPSQKTTWRTINHPSQNSKTKTLNGNCWFLSAFRSSEVTSDLRCLIGKQHLSGVRNPSASGSRVHHSMATFFVYRLNLGLLQFIFHELYPPL